MITKKHVNILIACEESQAECSAFRELGFNAFSCDIQKCKKGTDPGTHILGDVTEYLNGKTVFQTQDGKFHKLKKWHLIIAHPPCTYICRVSSVCMVKNGVVDKVRLNKMRQAVNFFLECLNAKADFVAVENPVPMKRAGLPKPSFYSCPSWYGVKYTKKTLWWVRNLPPLMPVIINPGAKSFCYRSKGKYRSRTFPSVAREIARQWGEFIINELRLRNN